MSAHPPTRQPRRMPPPCRRRRRRGCAQRLLRRRGGQLGGSRRAVRAPSSTPRPTRSASPRRRTRRPPRCCPPPSGSGGSIIAAAGAGGGTPPLVFTADDDKTVIGVEVDLAHLFADKLGLKVETPATSWENVFLGIDSGRYDVALSNVTVTEERKEKYDFATYRKDDLAFEAPLGGSWKVDERQGHRRQDHRRRVRHQPGEDPARLERRQRQGGARPRRGQVLPVPDRLLPRALVTSDRRVLRPEPERRLPRGDRGADRGDRSLLRRR